MFLRSFKVIAFGGLVLLGQHVTAVQYTPCQLANQNILKVMGDVQDKDQEFQRASADLNKAREVFNSSKLAVDYNKLMEPMRAFDPFDSAAASEMSKIRANPIFIQYQAEQSKLDAQWDAIKKGLEQRMKQNPAYQEAVKLSDYECQQPSSGFTPCQISIQNTRRVADQLTDKGEDYSKSPLYQEAVQHSKKECRK